MGASDARRRFRRTALSRQWRYAKLGWQLRPFAADRRSRLVLLGFASTVLIKQRSPWRDAPVRFRVRLHGRPFPIALAGRTEVDVLHEVATSDEYGPTDTVPARTIVDLGAHVGLATLRLLAAHPDAHVLAVEADPELIPRLRENVRELPVKVVHAAVGGESGTRTLYRASDVTWGNSLRRVLPSQVPVTVPAATLDDVLEREGIDTVDLLKIDIEGGEWEVFDDGVPDCVTAVVGELHAIDGRPASDLLDRMRPGLEIREGRVDDYRTVFMGTRPRRPHAPG
jgi:FkbM family methyltransferase